MFFYISRHNESNATFSLVIKCWEIQYGYHRLGKLHPNFSLVAQISSAFLTTLLKTTSTVYECTKYLVNEKVIVK